MNSLLHANYTVNIQSSEDKLHKAAFVLENNLLKYRLNNSVPKSKTTEFRASVRTKIVIEEYLSDQVSSFYYLERNTSSNYGNDVNYKLTKFSNKCGT